MTSSSVFGFLRETTPQERALNEIKQQKLAYEARSKSDINYDFTLASGERAPVSLRAPKYLIKELISGNVDEARVRVGLGPHNGIPESPLNALSLPEDFKFQDIEPDVLSPLTDKFNKWGYEIVDATDVKHSKPPSLISVMITPFVWLGATVLSIGGHIALTSALSPVIGLTATKLLGIPIVLSGLASGIYHMMRTNGRHPNEAGEVELTLKKVFEEETSLPADEEISAALSERVSQSAPAEAPESTIEKPAESPREGLSALSDVAFAGQKVPQELISGLNPANLPYNHRMEMLQSLKI